MSKKQFKYSNFGLYNLIRGVTLNSGLENFKKHLEEDKEWLMSWHSNIAIWFMDNMSIMEYETRNEMANRFILHFFDIKYDWKELLGGGKNETIKVTK